MPDIHMETSVPEAKSAPPRARAIPFAPWQWALILGLFAALLIARNPFVFITPQFWHEDYIVFFLEHREQGLGALLAPTAGYHILFSRLAAIGADFFPLKLTPLIYTSLTLAGWLWAAGWVLRSPLFPRRRWAIAAAFALLAVPSNGEVFLVLCCMQWPFGAALLLLLVEPAETKTSAVKSLFGLLAGLTGPFSLILTPVAAWRGFLHYRAQRRVDTLSIVTLLCAVVQLTALLLTSERAQNTAGADPHILAFGLGLWVFPQILGTYASYPGDLPLRSLGSVLGLAGMLWIVMPRPGSSSRRMLLAGAALALLVGFTACLAGFGAFPQSLGAGSRYYYVPCVAFIWGLLLAIANFPPRRRELLLPATLFALILFRAAEAPVAPRYPAPDWAAIVAASEQGNRVIFGIPPLNHPTHLDPIAK